jgi:LacI family repressor for deo operon, udp, cdd, tsx, nupC, and nupG
MKTQQGKGNPTVQDVARVAGVSTATVSRALSSPERVSKDAQLRVAGAVRETGYVVNRSARSLRRNQTGTIVALVPNIGNSFFSNILEGIESVCSQHDISVLIANSKKTSISHSKLATHFSNNNVDGIVVLDSEISIEEMRAQHDNLPPVATAGEWCSDPAVPVVLVNNLKGAELAVRHLWDLGHRSFGHVSGLLSHVPGQERLDGFCRTLELLDGNPSEAWVFNGDYAMESGRAAAQAWLVLSDRPTAVFCAGDGMAFGFISALHQAGIEVPRDLSVVGFDDIEVAQHYVPALTTVHQPRRALGAAAARHLIEVMQGDMSNTRTARLEPWLVVRNSTAEWTG